MFFLPDTLVCYGYIKMICRQIAAYVYSRLLIFAIYYFDLEFCVLLLLTPTLYAKGAHYFDLVSNRFRVFDMI